MSDVSPWETLRRRAAHAERVTRHLHRSWPGRLQASLSSQPTAPLAAPVIWMIGPRDAPAQLITCGATDARVTSRGVIHELVFSVPPGECAGDPGQSGLPSWPLGLLLQLARHARADPDLLAPRRVIGNGRPPRPIREDLPFHGVFLGQKDRSLDLAESADGRPAVEFLHVAPLLESELALPRGLRERALAAALECLDPARWLFHRSPVVRPWRQLRAAPGGSAGSIRRIGGTGE